MPTLLVVDDSAVDRKLVSGLLQQGTGWTVNECTDGANAVATLPSASPDLIVTDLQMPHMDGLALVRAVKDEWPYIPLVLLTARGSEEIAVEALRSGAASYVPKRRLGSDLVETVRRILVAIEADQVGQHLQHYLLSSDQTFRLQNDLDQIRKLTLYLQQQLRCVPLGDETERLRVSLAFEEALKNACMHGNLELGQSAAASKKDLPQRIQTRAAEPPYSGRSIHVTLRVDRQGAEFVVRDEGPGFAHEELLQSAVLDDQEQASTRGLALMRTIFDDVVFNTEGNEVTLCKRGILPAELDGEEDD